MMATDHGFTEMVEVIGYWSHAPSGNGALVVVKFLEPFHPNGLTRYPFCAMQPGFCDTRPGNNPPVDPGESVNCTTSSNLSIPTPAQITAAIGAQVNAHMNSIANSYNAQPSSLPAGVGVQNSPPPAAPSVGAPVIGKATVGVTQNGPAPSVFPAQNPEYAFAQQYGGTEQEFYYGSTRLKRNVAGFVVGGNGPGTMPAGILFDFEPGDQAIATPLTLVKVMLHQQNGGRYNDSWSKGKVPVTTLSANVFLVELYNVVQPPGSALNTPVIPVTGQTTITLPPPKPGQVWHVLQNPPLEFSEIKYESEVVNRAHYPKDCPKCGSPAYLGLTWDCSNKACK
jgi:hypothetical protein